MLGKTKVSFGIPICTDWAGEDAKASIVCEDSAGGAVGMAVPCGSELAIIVISQSCAQHLHKPGSQHSFRDPGKLAWAEHCLELVSLIIRALLVWVELIPTHSLLMKEAT